MSLPEKLCVSTVEKIVARTGLTEVEGADGGPFQTLVSVMGPDPVGSVRIFRGERIAKAVYVGIVVPQIGLDSHMVFAFMPDGSPVPHFTLDSVHSGDYYAFHLDLVQRADAGTHMVYNDWAHTPLTETFHQVHEMEGLSRAQLDPRQLTVMSSWMLANRASEEAFGQLDGPVEAYLEHWFSLVEGDVPADVRDDLADTDLAVRDARNRSLLFSADVDKVWAQISRLLGEDVAESVRLQLVTNEVVR
ncbi:hypothetical protein [Nocardioides alcanivorans]|uniref:hypothetical protein n=1 Tax=Nocardioides alcanivorans TaxID=2897352 RepID=UPI001F2DEDFE|nr:hypothetical protein [Nocardioides alcanivorans]